MCKSFFAQFFVQKEFLASWKASLFTPAGLQNVLKAGPIHLLTGNQRLVTSPNIAGSTQRQREVIRSVSETQCISFGPIKAIMLPVRVFYGFYIFINEAFFFFRKIVYCRVVIKM